MVEAVLFDIDGTLIDSVDLHAQAWQEALAKFGHRVSFDQVRSQIGKGGDQLLPVFLGEKDLALHGKALEEYRGQLFQRDYLARIRPFPAVRTLFRELIARGVRLALASSASGEELQVYKGVAQIADLLEAETSKDDVAKSKPHPDIFVAALHRLGKVNRQRTLVVGDTPYDAEAARRAGLRAVGVLCGGFPEGELRAAGCIAVYRDPEALLRELDQSALALG